MIVSKTLSFKGIMTFAGVHLIWLTLWCTLVVSIFEVTQWEWMELPWLPLSVIGTAVAFYLGFKNNSSYDRLWEARKIWGGIVNASRSWGTMVKNFPTNNPSNNKQFTQKEIDEKTKKLIYHHIAWLYGLRHQLLESTQWEHVNQWYKKKYIKRKMEKFGVGNFKNEFTLTEFKKFLSAEEFVEILKYKNRATHIIDHQSKHINDLKSDGLIDEFRHMQLQQMITEFYTLQGKCERIKKFPLPRQYSSMSYLFVGIFIFLLPFGMLGAFSSLKETTDLVHSDWLSIPFAIIIGWVYVLMELVGDYSENPFEGLANDIPMLSLCRTIEIDLREMIGETDLPPAIQPKEDILM